MTATVKQIRMIRAKQRAVGGRLASAKQIAPMSRATIQRWVEDLDNGINPYDHTEGPSAEV